MNPYLSECKLENCSTSSSMYFSKKCIQSSLNQKEVTSILEIESNEDTQRDSKSGSFQSIKSAAKVSSMLTKPSQLTQRLQFGDEQSQSLSQNKNRKTNPFLSTEYSQQYKYRPDSIAESNRSIEAEFRKSTDPSRNFAAQRSLKRNSQSNSQWLPFRSESEYNHCKDSPKTRYEWNGPKLECPKKHSRDCSKQNQRHDYLKSPCKTVDFGNGLESVLYVQQHESQLKTEYFRIMEREKQRVRNQMQHLKKLFENRILELQNELFSQLDTNYQKYIDNLNRLRQKCRLVFGERAERTARSNSRQKFGVLKNSLQKKQLFSPRQNSFKNEYCKRTQSNQKLFSELKEQDGEMNDFVNMNRFYSDQRNGQTVLEMFRMSKMLIEAVKGQFVKQISLQSNLRKSHILEEWQFQKMLRKFQGLFSIQATSN